MSKKSRKNTQNETELEKHLREEIREEEARGRSGDNADGIGLNPDSRQQDPAHDESLLNDEDVAEILAEETAAEEDVNQLQDELNELRDHLMRARADFDNYRKRIARDNERVRKMAAENLIRDLLPALDNLELAMQHAGDDSGGLSEGVQMVHKQLLATLERHGLQPIQALGQRFDPRYHEAVSQVPSQEVPEDNVAEEYQRGYQLADQVIRPSKVVVSTGAPQKEAENG